MGRLTKAGRERAAQLLAEGRLSDEKISEVLGIARRSLADLKKKPDFDARVKELLRRFAEESLKFGIARRETRISVQQELQSKLLTVIDERATEAQQANSTVPGMKTGLVCRSLKGIGKGSDFQVVETFETDVSTVKALVALHELAAREMGQFVESELQAKSGLAEMVSEARRRVKEGLHQKQTGASTWKERVN